jgi:hypothetical protein
MSAISLRNATNLAYWFYRVHPELFAELVARTRPTLARFGRLGDNGDGIITDTSTAGGGIITDTTEVITGIDPSLVSMPDPELADVGIGAAISDVNVPIDVPTAPVASSTIAAPGGLAGALGSVGSFLASTTGLGAVANLATAYYRSNTPQAQTIATQLARVQAGATPAAITYGYNSAGQVVPVLAQTGQALTPQTLSSLIPSNWKQYAIPVGIGLVLIWLLNRG